jgi:hypothetical protein
MKNSRMRSLFILSLFSVALLQTACMKDPDASGAQEEEKYKFAGCAIRYQGKLYVHFAAYQDQPQDGENGRPGDARDRFRPYCQDIPAATKTFMTVDIVDKEIREKLLTVRVTEHSVDAEGAAAAPLKLVEVPPKKYENGVVEVTANFTEAGMYDLLLLEEGGNKKNTITIPLSVGLNPPSDTKPMLIAVSVLTLFILAYLVYYVISRRSPAESQAAHEPKPPKPKRDPNTW